MLRTREETMHAKEAVMERPDSEGGERIPNAYTIWPMKCAIKTGRVIWARKNEGRIRIRRKGPIVRVLEICGW